MRTGFFVFFGIFPLFAFDQILSGTCGSPEYEAAFVVNGSLSLEGSWPWLASVHLATNDEYVCGGVFIGSNLVVTVSSENF